MKRSGKFKECTVVTLDDGKTLVKFKRERDGSMTIGPIPIRPLPQGDNGGPWTAVRIYTNGG